ncbi:hypothetical protein [uncultured Mucilaginibacter sp.]|nr:hypothetical protein [uncultured Mucilaginibacter sp.]
MIAGVYLSVLYAVMMPKPYFYISIADEPIIANTPQMEENDRLDK